MTSRSTRGRGGTRVTISNPYTGRSYSSGGGQASSSSSSSSSSSNTSSSSQKEEDKPSYVGKTPAEYNRELEAWKSGQSNIQTSSSLSPSNTFVSRDTTKPYYGQEVYRDNSGQIKAVNPIQSKIEPIKLQSQALASQPASPLKVTTTSSYTQLSQEELKAYGLTGSSQVMTGTYKAAERPGVVKRFLNTSEGFLANLFSTNQARRKDTLKEVYQDTLAPAAAEDIKKNPGKYIYGGLTTAALLTPIPGDEIIAGSGFAARSGKAAISTAKYLQEGARFVAVTETITGGSKKYTQATAKTPISDEAFRAGMQQEQQAFSDKVWYKKYAQSIPGVPLIAGDKPAFKQGITNYYSNLGFQGKELQDKVNEASRQRTFAYGSEAASVLAANVQSEIFGRKLVSGAFSKTSSIAAKDAPSKIFFKSGFQIGKAGTLEGGASELATQRARREETNLKNIGIAAGVGGVTAFVLGGTIGALRLNKPGLSKAVETGSYLIDPFEKPGDILADTAIKGLKLPVLTPTIIDTRRSKNIILTATEEGKTPTISKTKTIINIPTEIGTDQINIGELPKPPSNINNILPQITPTDTKTPTNIKTPTDTSTPVNIDTSIPSMTPTDITNNIFTSTPTNTPANVPNIIPTSIPIPTIVPNALLPPPLPLTFPGLGGSGGFSTRKRKKYFNELEIGGRLLKGGLFGQPSIFAKPKAAAKPKTKKKKATRSQPTRQYNAFIPMIRIPGIRI